MNPNFIVSATDSIQELEYYKLLNQFQIFGL